MILYIAGDEHTIGAKLTNNYIFANEDSKTHLRGKVPHPDNLHSSWANLVAYALKMQLNVGTVSHTNKKTIEVVDTWLDSVSRTLEPSDVFMIIGWHKKQENESDVLIRNYHLYLEHLEIKHVFYSTDELPTVDYDFREAFVDTPYLEYIKNKDCKPVLMSNTYYGKDAHREWAKYMLLHIVKNKIV